MNFSKVISTVVGLSVLAFASLEAQAASRVSIRPSVVRPSPVRVKPQVSKSSSAAVPIAAGVAGAATGALITAVVMNSGKPPEQNPSQVNQPGPSSVITCSAYFKDSSDGGVKYKLNKGEVKLLCVQGSSYIYIPPLEYAQNAGFKTILKQVYDHENHKLTMEVQ